VTLVRPASSLLWELRAAWATGRRVSLSLDERCIVHRVEGWVEQVAATGAFVVVNGWHVPTDAILAVHNPSRVGDSTVGERERWHGRPRRVVPQDEELDLEAA
jgi:hypothetical protein